MFIKELVLRFAKKESLFKTIPKLAGILIKTIVSWYLMQTQLPGNNNNMDYLAFLIHWYQNIIAGGVSLRQMGNLKIKMITILI